MLVNHLTWKTKEKEEEGTGNETTTKVQSNFVSWTNFLPFASQLGFCREATDCPNCITRLSTTFENIEIYFLDTRKLPPGTFLPVPALSRRFAVPYGGKTRHDYYDAEFLLQGAIDIPKGAMVMTTLRSLIDNGLYDLVLDFKDATTRTELCRPIQRLRESFLMQLHNR
jgi:hypothetical protein